MDPILNDMLPEFLESWKRDGIETLRSIIEGRNRDELFRFGHTLYGSAAQFDVPSLMEFGRVFEECSRNADWSDASQKRIDLISTVQTLIDDLSSSDHQSDSVTVPSNL